MSLRAKIQLLKSKLSNSSATRWLTTFLVIASLFEGYAGVTSIYIESDVGDPIENGNSFSFTPVDGVFTAAKNQGNGVSAYFNSSKYSHYLSLDFAAPSNRVITVGRYMDAAYYPYQQPDEPGLNVIDDYGFSHSVTGWFEVKQIAFGAGNEVQQFWATFEQHIDGMIPALRGEIRFNAEIPVAVTGPGSPATIPGRTISFTVTASESENRIVSLTASNLPPGATFVDNGDNSGVFSWTPKVDQTVVYPTVYPITFFADNQNGSTDRFVSQLTVNVPDDFNDAVMIDAANFTNIVDTTYATRANDDPRACHSPVRTVWYSFTPPKNMVIEVDVWSGYLPTLDVYTGIRGALQPVTCDSLRFGKVMFDAVAGQTYYIMAGESSSSSGPLTLALVDLSPPPNPADRHAVHRYFPLHNGDSRNYSGNGVNLTLSVAPWDGDGVPMLYVRNSIDQSTTDYTYTETGLVMHSLTSGGLKLYIDAFDELSEGLILNGGTQITRTTGSFLGHRVNITFKAVVKNAGTIAVPAGTYENCRDVTESMLISVPHGRSSKSHQHFVLAPEVGVIKIFSTTHPTESIGLVSGTIEGVNVSSLAAKSAVASPRILSQPKKQTPLDGSHAEFDVVADGSGPLSYQWLKNGIVLTNDSLISGVDTSHLVLSAVNENDLGNYSVTITNQAGLISSASAILTLTPDRIRPTVMITSPRPRARVVNSPVTIVGRASDNAAVAQVLYQLNGGEWSAISGTTSWQISLSLSPGENLFRVCALDFAGNYSRTNSLTVLY